MTNAEILKKLRAEAVLRGDCAVCRCRRAKPDRRTCQHCLDMVHERNEAKRKEWQAAGLCGRCGAKTGGYRYCTKHREYSANLSALHDEIRISQFRCVNCNGVRLPNRTMCAKCLDAMADKERARRGPGKPRHCSVCGGAEHNAMRHRRAA